MIKESICVQCLCNEWCKAYDKTDLSLNDCNNFVDYETNKHLIKNIFFKLYRNTV